jgi:ribosome-associated protein
MTKKKVTKDSTTVLLDTIVSGIQEVKGIDIIIMDLRELNNAMTDFFVICHGNSSTQVQALARAAEKETIDALGEKPWHIEGSRNAKWILMDYINVVVHIFDQESRYYYSIEELWADARVTQIPEIA